jgi:GNAT superfamily N-acetyltransferase
VHTVSKNPRIEIADALPEDASVLAKISKRAFESDIEVGATKKGGPAGYASVAAHRQDTLSTYLDYIKILLDDKIAGGMRVHKANDAGQYDIWGVFVDPDYHRQGIGTKAFQLVMKRYDDARVWTLDTPEWNVRTRAFYEGMGFVQKGVLRWEEDFELIYYELLIDESYEHPLVRIADLEDGMSHLSVEAKVLSIGNIRNVYSKKDGKKHLVAEALLRDKSGEVPLVLWDEFIRQVRKDELIRVEGGYTREFQGRLSLNASRYGRIIILIP